MSATKPKKMKAWHYIFFAIVIIWAIGLKVYIAYWPKTELDINGRMLKVLVADTPDHRFEGWSNKKSMGRYDGMLFVFNERSQHTMVMRDMKFPLDIVWLDGLNIVDMAPNVQPEDNIPEEELTPYFARLSSTMVLELPAGFIGANQLKIGDKIEIIKK